MPKKQQRPHEDNQCVLLHLDSCDRTVWIHVTQTHANKQRSRTRPLTCGDGGKSMCSVGRWWNSDHLVGSSLDSHINSTSIICRSAQQCHSTKRLPQYNIILQISAQSAPILQSSEDQIAWFLKLITFLFPLLCCCKSMEACFRHWIKKKLWLFLSQFWLFPQNCEKLAMRVIKSECYSGREQQIEKIPAN